MYARDVCEPEHYNDFEQSFYQFLGDEENFYFGFSTYGYNDIIKNGGNEILQTAYKEYLLPSGAPFKDANFAFSVKRSILPAKQRLIIS